MSVNPLFLTLNTLTPIPEKHPKILCSYCTQLESRSPVAALTFPLRFCGFSWSWDSLSGLCTHSIVMSREKIYSQISHLEKGRMGSLVNRHGKPCKQALWNLCPKVRNFLDFTAVFNLRITIFLKIFYFCIWVQLINNVIGSKGLSRTYACIHSFPNSPPIQAST